MKKSMLLCVVVIGLAGTLGAGTVTRATLQGEIDAAARGGGKVAVPAGGHFMEGPLHLRSNVELVLADGAELVFTDDPKAYLPVQFNRCKGVRLENFRIRESPFWCVHLYQSEDCMVRGLDIRARGHNNDGIDIDMTRNVLIENCTLDQGDDAFVVKSGRNCDGWRINRSTENVEIRNCRVIHGHTLLGIGSDLSAGIRGVRIHDCTVEDSVFRAFYIKTSLAARLKARGESLEAIRAAELAFVLGAAKRRFGKPATVLAGSATYAAAERAAREHPELVGRLIRAQGEKTVLPQ